MEMKILHKEGKSSGLKIVVYSPSLLGLYRLIVRDLVLGFFFAEIAVLCCLSTPGLEDGLIECRKETSMYLSNHLVPFSFSTALAADSAFAKVKKAKFDPLLGMPIGVGGVISSFSLTCLCGQLVESASLFESDLMQ